MVVITFYIVLQSSSDEDSYIEPLKKPRAKEPEISPSVNSLLLQEMIEFKRRRAEQQHHEAKKLESPQKPPNTQGIMIMPREEIPTDGVLRLAASREIKWKIDKNNVQMTPKLPGAPLGQSSQSTLRTPSSSAGRPPNPVNVVHKKAAGLAPGQKIIKILASAPGSGMTAVRQTAENVKVSSDGYLILNGKPTSIKVTPNTKIVIQPQGGTTAQGSPLEGTGSAATGSLGKELIVKKIPTPAGCTPLADLQAGGSTTYRVVETSSSHSGTVPTITNVEASKQPPEHPPNSGPQLPTINSHVSSQPAAGPGRPAIQTTGPNSNPNHHPDPVEMRKRQYDMAQRLLAAKRKQLMQNGPINQKMARLDPKSPNSSPNFATNNQLNSAMSDPSKRISSNVEPRSVNVLSSNVVQNVNISGDILDSYYSVLNEANAQKPVQTSAVNNLQVQNLPVNSNQMAQMDQNHRTVTNNIAAPVARPNVINSGVSQEAKNLSISALTTALARNLAAPNNLPQRVVQTQHQINPQVDPMTRLHHSSVRPNPNQLTSQNQANHSVPSMCNKSVVIDSGGEPHVPPQTLSNTQPSSFSAALSKHIESTVIANQTSLPNLLTKDSVDIQNHQQISNIGGAQNPTQVSHSEIRPIEALLMGQNSASVSCSNNMLPSTTNIPPNSSVYSHLNISPPKSDRQNLFDMFESNEKYAKVTKSDDFGFANLVDKTEKSPGRHPPFMSMKGKGKEFVGSPLNISVMEALKSKLSPGKHTHVPTVSISNF